MRKVYMIFGTLDEHDNFRVSLVEQDPGVLMKVLKSLEKHYAKHPAKKTEKPAEAKQT